MTEAKEFLWRDYTVDECMACARGMPNDDDLIRAKLGWKMADEIERLRGLLREARDEIDCYLVDLEVIRRIDAALGEVTPVQPDGARPEPFIVKHYAGDERPIIKGNGFDGLEVGEDRQDAEEFVAWVNARIGVAPSPTTAAPSTNSPEISSGLVIADSASGVEHE